MNTRAGYQILLAVAQQAAGLKTAATSPAVDNAIRRLYFAARASHEAKGRTAFECNAQAFDVNFEVLTAFGFLVQRKDSHHV
jgi:hypothetical protein